MRDATIDLTRQKQLVEEHYAAFWSDASDEPLAAQLAPDFRNLDHVHRMVADGLPRKAHTAAARVVDLGRLDHRTNVQQGHERVHNCAARWSAATMPRRWSRKYARRVPRWLC